ncbi:MAG: hypothetical protein ABL949_13630 [Fimbriimonadaceae bacterium]
MLTDALVGTMSKGDGASRASGPKLIRTIEHAREQMLPCHRELSPKSVQLARVVFTQTFYPVNEAHPDYSPTYWQPLFEEWNREFAPSLSSQKTETAAYKSLAKFKKDAIAARDHILNPKITRPNGPTIQAPKEEIYRRPRRGNAKPKKDV